MADRESIKKNVWDENVGTLNSSKNDIDAQAEQERLKQRQEAETEINKVNGKAKQEVDSLYKDYDMAEKLGAVQKLLNERYIRRKMAEWGLSSSGTLNGNLKRAEHLSQKASTLNREVFNKGKLGVTDWKTGQIAEIEKVRDGNIGVIDKNAADLKKQADDDFNKWVDAETNRQYSYAVEQEQKLLRQKNERIHAVSASIADLKGKLGGYLTESAKWTCIQSHIEKYGVSDALINMLGGSGYGKDEALQKMTSFFNNKKVSDQYKIQRFVDYYKIYGMPSEEYMKAITSGNMPGHNVTMSELKSALASIDETAYAKNRAIATNSEYDPFILSGKQGAELLGQYEGYWRQKDARKKEAEKLWEYATTPQLPKSATGRTPPYISSPTKKETNGLSFNPIAVTGAPYSKESGVKLVSPEAYDVIMKERERQNKLYEGAKSYDEYLEEHDLEEYKVTDKWSVQDREKLYTLFEKSPKEALSYAKTVNAELDKSAENVKMKAEESEKSSYEQVIDELAELLRERKDNKALSFWDKLESRVSTSDRSYNSGKNPVSNFGPVGSGGKGVDLKSNSDYKVSPFELVQNFASAVDGFELIIGDVKFVKDGKYINIKGDRAILDKFNINQTRIKADNIKNFQGIAELANSSTAISKALKTKSNWALAGISIIIETARDMSQYKDWDDKLIIGSYDIVSGAIGTGLSLAGGALAGAKIGSAVSPGWGTLGGIAVGALIGGAYDLLIDEPIKDILVINLVES